MQRPKAVILIALLCTYSLPLSGTVAPGSLEFFVNDAGASNYDHGLQTNIASGFGDGEFTLEIWIRPNEFFPVGPVGGGSNQRENWANTDNQPYSNSTWWYEGNFLLDSHNNSGFRNGTFSLQFYGAGRVRWLFGDGSPSTPSGDVWSIGAYPATNTPTLLDGNWHQLTLVRRWSGATDADLELWIDGALVGTEQSDRRTDMRQWWDAWNSFPSNQRGWFWGAEKQAAVGVLSQYEDYKGLLDELRFWSRAKTAAEISSGYQSPVTGSEPGLVSWFDLGEAQGTETCDLLAPTRCIALVNTGAQVWSGQNAPLSNGGDSTPPTTPTNLVGIAVSESQIDLTWSAATDNVGVTGYDVTRDGSTVTTVQSPSFSDLGLMPDSIYSYSVAARDAAGNTSPASAPVMISTLNAPDTEPPTIPQNLNGISSTPSQVDLTWSPSTDNIAVSEYTIRRDGVSIATSTDTLFADNGLVANTLYTYDVIARDGSGNESAPSQPFVITTLANVDTEPPTTPTNVSGNSVSANEIELSWNASTDNVGVAEYEVVRDGTTVGFSPTPTFRDTGLASSTTYAYAIRAADAAGNESQLSGSVSVTTQSPVTPNSSGGSGAFGMNSLLLLTIAWVCRSFFLRRRMGAQQEKYRQFISLHFGKIN